MFGRLVVATERIALLDETVADLTAEKAKDVQLYSAIIAKSKFVLRDHLRRRKRSELGRSECVVAAVAESVDLSNNVLQDGIQESSCNCPLTKSCNC